MEAERGSNYRIPHSNAFAFPNGVVIPRERNERALIRDPDHPGWPGGAGNMRASSDEESAPPELPEAAGRVRICRGLVLNAQGSLASAECSTVPASPRSLCYPPA